MVDLTIEERRGGFSFLSDPLRAHMEDALARKGQVLLFLNRRGWASVLLCRSCRTALRCPHCEVSMTLHRRIHRVLCHYCGHEQPPPGVCPTCGGPLAPLGYGTEKVEEEVRQKFLHASVARMDSDTMSGRGAHEITLSDFAAGRTQVLIGTQMIAKGLDFPNVTLVGVICADSALFLPDYRAAERTFQLLAQVTGRTGRGPKGGRVVVQAFNPRHFSIALGVAQDFEAFAKQELPLRQEAGYPPFSRLVRIITQAPGAADASARCTEIALELRRDGGLPGVVVLGPAVAPIARINNQHRFHVVCKCASDGAVSAVLGRLAGHTAPARKARVLLDVDPVAML
jgi:primosomal protein N' (replication factor Y)